jgi:hypothetical protein
MSKNPQDYAQKPQQNWQNWTLMNSASAAVNTKYNVEIESVPTLLAAS